MTKSRSTHTVLELKQDRCSSNNQDILVKAGERNLSYSVINLKIKSKWGWGGTIGNKTMMKILPHFRSLPLYVRIVTTTSNLVMPPHNIKLIHSHIP